MKTLEEIQKTELIITKDLILRLISFIDLTTLNNDDTEKTVGALINKANKGFNKTYPAAVCTFSNFGAFAKKQINSTINIAVVGGCFPTGQTLSDAKIEECRIIAKSAVDEIDIVLNRGDFFSGNYAQIETEISGIKAAIGTKHLKVILETGDLKTDDNIRLASELAIKSGADFIKTSTGKTSIGATPDAVFTMCNVIKTHFNTTGKYIGIKPSGGIRTLDDAIIYYKIVQHVLGDKWLHNSLFRIGASSLYGNLMDSYTTI